MRALYIPILIVLLGAVRSGAVLLRLSDLGGYIRKVEASFQLVSLGWESRGNRKEANSSLLKDSPFVISAVVFWGALLVVAVVAVCKLS